MDRLDAMSVFMAAVETGSLSAAGRRLDMPLATVSRKLSDLESHMRTRLLHRSTRKLALTDAGADYYEACRRILEQVDEAERAAGGEYVAPRGELVVTAPILFGRLCVLPAALEFLQSYPDVDLRLVLGDRLLNLGDDHIDLAVRIGELPDSRLVATRVGMIRRVACGSPDYFARRGEPRRPADLGNHDLIGFEGLANAWNFAGKGGTVAARGRMRLVVNTADAAIDAAIAGAGIAQVLSYQVADACRTGALTLVLREVEPPPLPVSLVHAARGRLPMKLRAFIDFLGPRLRALLAEANAPC